MNKRKIIVVVVFFFLIVGLGTFVFANPSDKTEYENNTTKPSDESEKITDLDDEKNNGKDDEKSPDKGNDKTDNKVVITYPEDKKPSKPVKPVEPTPVVDYYKEALDEVKKAESLFESFTSKEELNNIKELLTNEVALKLGKVSDNDKLSALQKRLEKIYLVVNDESAPVIKGVPQNISNEIVSLEISDELEVKILLNNKPKTIKDLKHIASDGEYELVVTDKAFNETKVNFVIDRTNPKVNGVVNNKYYKDAVLIKVEDKYLDNIKLNGEDFENNTYVTDSGTYLLEATDKAGNKTEVNFVIDKTSPVITGVTNDEHYKESVLINIADENLDVIKLNGEKFENNTSVSKPGTYLLEAIDKAGNKSEVNFVIDKLSTKIVLNAPENLVYSNTIKTVEAKLYDENNQELTERILIEYDKEVKNAGTYKVKATYSGNDYYLESNEEIEFTITKAPINIVINSELSSYSKTNGISAKQYSAVVNGVNGENITSSVKMTKTYTDINTGKVTTIVPKVSGEYRYTVTVLESDNYFGGEKSEEYEVKNAVLVNGKVLKTPTLSYALTNAKDGDVITLNDNITNFKLNKRAKDITKNITIDLNGHNLELDASHFDVAGAEVTLTGAGIIGTNEVGFAVFELYGSQTNTTGEYTVLNVGENVTLEGDMGVNIIHRTVDEISANYGTKLNLNGTIRTKALSEIPNFGIYVHGNVTNIDNAPIINISNTAQIISGGVGIYNAGYATINNAGKIEGHTGVAIKSGIFNMTGGSILATGEKKIPLLGMSSGTNLSGSALQIESNSGYIGKMQINITGGLLESKNALAIYEFIGAGNSTQVINFNVKDAILKSNENEAHIYTSNDFANKFQEMINNSSYDFIN